MNSLRTSGRAGLYRGIADWTINTFMTAVLNPKDVIESMFELARRSPAVLLLATPARSSRIAWTEFRNKSEAFGLFATADAMFGSDQRLGCDLFGAVGRSSAISPYAGLWTTEGIGYYYCSAILRDTAQPFGMFTGPSVDRFPSRSLVPLHTGMGLALANWSLAQVSDQGSPNEIRRMLAEFLALCRVNARPGYTDAVIEAVGLIAQILRPSLVRPIDRHLRETDPELIACYWHGVGRGLYFSPGNALPFGNLIWPGLKRACDEPPHDLGRANAIAGFAWAVTLVNIREPAVLEMLLRHHGDALADTSAFANGVRSAATIWHDWAPQTPYLERLCRFRPKGADSDLLEIWNRNATSPCDGTFVRDYDRLKIQSRWGELFRIPAIASS